MKRTGIIILCSLIWAVFPCSIGSGAANNLSPEPPSPATDGTLPALTAFWIADGPEHLDTPWTVEQTAKMLVGKNLDNMLKAFGLWPFGELGSESKEKPPSTS